MNTLSAAVAWLPSAPTLAGGALLLGAFQFALAVFSAAGQRDARALGARDTPLPPLRSVAGRLDRAYRNWLETFPLFFGAVVTVELAGGDRALAAPGAAIYLVARILYVPLYAAGVPVVRFWVWLASMAGVGLCLAALWPLLDLGRIPPLAD